MINNQYQVLNEILISGEALLHNYSYFAKLQPSSLIAPVIKSNAYGHGLIPVAKFIESNIKDIPFVCVDSLYEAYELTNNRINVPTLIMGYTNPQNYHTLRKLPYIFGISDLQSLISLGKHQPNETIHLELDTGMSRLGFSPKDIPVIIETLQVYPRLKIEGIYSHFSCADDPSKITITQKQITQFKLMATALEQAGLNFKYKHISATAGAESIFDPYFNLIRLGIGFYGYSPFAPRTSEGIKQRQVLKPSLTLTSHIAHLKTLEIGDHVGYGATYIAKQKEVIATLPLGYNEAISRDLSNIGVVTIKNTICPIIGRVSMNMTTIKIPRTLTPQLNDLITVIADHVDAPNSLYKTSSLLHTIPYTLLTSLHSSIKRRVV